MTPKFIERREASVRSAGLRRQPRSWIACKTRNVTSGRTARANIEHTRHCLVRNARQLCDVDHASAPRRRFAFDPLIRHAASMFPGCAATLSRRLRPRAMAAEIPHRAAGGDDYVPLS